MELAAIVAILCLATLFHGTLGFGTGLVAMPLLTLVLGVQDATALVAFVIVGTTIVLLRRNWRRLDRRAAIQLVISSIPGVPIGIFVLTNAPTDLIQRGLGVLLIVYALYSLLGPPLFEARHAAWAYVLGFASGVLGGAYNTNAPPVVVFGTLRRWPPDVFRATLQAYFVPLAIVVWLGHGVSGLWSQDIVVAYTVYLPFGLVALWGGHRVAGRIPAASFQRVLYIAVIALGALLLV
jgi:uncharacterized membrane protein YfcA